MEAIAACRNVSSEHELRCREVTCLQLAELGIFIILPAVDTRAVWLLQQGATRGQVFLLKHHRIASPAILMRHGRYQLPEKCPALALPCQLALSKVFRILMCRLISRCTCIPSFILINSAHLFIAFSTQPSITIHCTHNLKYSFSLIMASQKRLSSSAAGHSGSPVHGASDEVLFDRGNFIPAFDGPGSPQTALTGSEPTAGHHTHRIPPHRFLSPHE